MKTQSSPGGGGFNEICLDDKAGGEEVYIHAQKDLNIVVLNNHTETVTTDHAITVQNGKSSFTVSKGDWSTVVATGGASHTVKGNLTQEVDGNITETTKGDYSHSVSGNVTLNVTGNITIKASGTMDLEDSGALTIKGATVQITASASGTVDGGGVLNLKGGMVNLN